MSTQGQQLKKLTPEHVQLIANSIRSQGNSPSADSLKLLTYRLVQSGIDKADIDREILQQIHMYSLTIKTAVDKIKWNEIALEFGANPKDIEIAVDVVDTTCCLFLWATSTLVEKPSTNPPAVKSSVPEGIVSPDSLGQ